MKVPHVVALGLAWTLAASPAFAEVTLTLGNGRVTLVAKDATVRQILAEWARIGQTKIINLERVPGGPVSMELDNVSEAEALDVLLRAVSGYLAAPRPVEAANLSHFDRIVVMPTSVAPRPAVSAAPPPPVFRQAPFGQRIPADDEEDDNPATNMPTVRPNRGPIFNPSQQPQVVNPQFGPPGGSPQPEAPVANPPASPTIFPRAPSAPPGGGVSTPGMIVQPPQPAPGTPTTGRGGQSGA